MGQHSTTLFNLPLEYKYILIKKNYRIHIFYTYPPESSPGFLESGPSLQI